MTSYREQIIETLNKLIEAREIVFERILNLAMSDEYEEIDEVFQAGDIEDFSLEHFKQMEDPNIHNLVKLCKEIELSIFYIMNLNDIKDDDIDL